MIKPSERHRDRTTPSVTDWKNSPFVIAALSVAGTATFMASVVMPLTTLALTAKLEALAPAAEKIDELQSALDKANKQLTLAEGDLFAVREGNPLAPDSPYPSGIDRVKLGDPFDNVRNVYSPESIKKAPESSYVSVAVKHPVFSTVVYYPSAEGRVVLILLHFDYRSKIKPEHFQEMLRMRYGAPAKDSKIAPIWEVEKNRFQVSALGYEISALNRPK